jgi:HK97 family phage prohead protease
VAETSPGDARATERLHDYWVRGDGAAKIRWGEPGDYDRCVLHLGKFLDDPHGYCAQAHHDALGIWPATHAAMEKHAGRAEMATDTKAPYGTGVDYGDPGYLDADGNQASKSGKPGVKRYPLSPDKVMAAWAYISQAKNADQYTPEQLAGIKGRIKAAMAKHGHDTGEPASASRAEFLRIYSLEDIHIIRSEQGGDGRVVEAYAAVFGQEAEIQDHEGHYLEVIEPAAFNRAIDHASRARGGFASSVKVLWNHGRDLSGNPSDRFSMPIGVPVHIQAEARGVLTRTRYSETPLADEVLENIRNGSITAQSFVGPIMRSDPQLRRGDKYRPGPGGNLRTVRRTELGLRDYGPVLWAAYSGAEILGVRMSTPGENLDPDELDEGTLSDEGPAAGDPPAGDSNALERHHQHELYALRSRAQREANGLTW